MGNATKVRLRLNLTISKRLNDALNVLSLSAGIEKGEVIEGLLEELLIEDYNSAESHRKLDEMRIILEQILGKLLKLESGNSCNG
jgi:hypothetical protein